MKNEINFIKKKLKEIQNNLNILKEEFKINIQNIKNEINNGSLIKNFEAFNDIESLEKEIKLSFGKNKNDVIENNANHNNSIKNSQIEYLNEIKIKREIQNVIKVISNNEYSIKREKNIIPEINIKIANSYYKKIKYNITFEAEKIFQESVKPLSNDIFLKYKNFYLDELENNYKSDNYSYEIVKKFKQIIPTINMNFIEEVKIDLNSLFLQLFNLIDKSISLSNNKKSEINLENKKKEYYEKIEHYLQKNIDSTEIKKTKPQIIEDIREILFISIKGIKQRKIKSIKSFINSFFTKYENIKNESYYDSIISKSFEYNKKEELYLSFLNIYNEITNQALELPELNKNINKTNLVESIKNVTLSLYSNNYNNFKKKFLKEKNNDAINNNDNEELMNLIEIEIQVF